MNTILVIRFSAVGDVAMTIPVLHSFAREYPECKIIFVSRAAFEPMFHHTPDNLIFVGADLKGEHKGLHGLTKLCRTLRCYPIDAVADLHNVLRSWYIDFHFKLHGTPIAILNKGRKDKKRLCREGAGKSDRLTSTFERYQAVFARLDYPFPLRFTSIFGEERGDLTPIASLLPPRAAGDRWVGIAPFARHKGKIYPLDKMRAAVMQLASQPHLHIFLFGNGNREKELMEMWEREKPALIHSFVGKTALPQELALISHLDAMVSMDSANMHLASLVNTPVISVWGATSPRAGFLGWGQKEENCVQRNDLLCRPCSIYGSKPCRRKDYACLDIPPQEIVNKVLEVIHEKE